MFSQIFLKTGKANQPRHPPPSSLLLWDCQVFELQDVLTPACTWSAGVSSQLNGSSAPPKKVPVGLATRCLNHLDCAGAVDWRQHVLRFLSFFFHSEWGPVDNAEKHNVGINARSRVSGLYSTWQHMYFRVGGWSTKLKAFSARWIVGSLNRDLPALYPRHSEVPFSFCLRLYKLLMLEPPFGPTMRYKCDWCAHSVATRNQRKLQSCLSGLWIASMRLLFNLCILWGDGEEGKIILKS